MEGADDYILKDRLKRLPHAVLNALEKYTFEKERIQIIDDTREKEAISKEFAKTNADEREVLLSELTKSLKDLKEFTYITSHNFKAPLSNLQALLSLIDTKTLCENNRGIIEMFTTATGQLSKTINDLVEILLIRSKSNVNVAEVCFEELVQHASNLLQVAIAESHCIINQNFQVKYIEYNQLYLESIFMNLLSNAIKYRSPDRILEVNISTSINRSGELLLTFRDNGMGINLKRHRDKIFGLYQRFHVNTEGVGLGLFIVKSQVNSMGGTIEIDSIVDDGSTFTINFGKLIVTAAA
jgi:signal transduction histidine kinase